MKSFYTAKSLRERTLMLLFVAIALAWWGSSALGRLARWRQDFISLATERAEQDLWIKNSTAIADQAAVAAKQLDPVRTLDASQLLAELNQFAAGLNAEIGAQRTDRTTGFAMHSMQLNLRRVDLPGLLRFYRQLAARTPYIGIEQASLTVDRANPGLLNASFRISAVQAIRQ
ncbi:MAG: hypothetical protein ACHQ5A_13005 [Opitutales bacterium]